MRHLPIALLVFLLATPGYSQDYRKGLAAAERGDYAAALREWRALAEQGHVNAQYDLGAMYFAGRGVQQDYANAVKWFRLAADQGDAKAQYNLGFMYFEGRGVPEDFERAHMWFDIAAERGLRNAAKDRDIVPKFMTPAQITEAERLAKEWRKARPQ